MKINNKKLYNFLTSKGITHLHHANTVSTAITFIENDGLLSRGYVEKYGLHQTPQVSDNKDKDFDVWDDVFIDTVDLHGFFPRQNLYGPVLFKFSANALLDERFEIWITKGNPQFWKSIYTMSNKYFQDYDDLVSEWDLFPTQRKMITIRKPNMPILFNYLENIVIDDPCVRIYGDTSLGHEAYQAIVSSLDENPLLQTNLEIRTCKSSCYCHKNYMKDFSLEKLASLFLPKTHKRFYRVAS